MMATGQFEDIRIVGMDGAKTHNPDPSKLLYNIYFRLSKHPSSEWAQLFEQEHHFPRHSMWRRARIEGEFIVLHAPLSEVDEHHLSYLKEDVENANSKYQQYLQKKLARDEQQKAEEEQERQRVEDLKNTLKFD
jgi:hypothetical protein